MPLLEHQVEQTVQPSRLYIEIDARCCVSYLNLKWSQVKISDSYQQEISLPVRLSLPKVSEVCLRHILASKSHSSDTIIGNEFYTKLFSFSVILSDTGCIVSDVGGLEQPSIQPLLPTNDRQQSEDIDKPETLRSLPSQDGHKPREAPRTASPKPGHSREPDD